jgi:hypothetical protein
MQCKWLNVITLTKLINPYREIVAEKGSFRTIQLTDRLGLVSFEHLKGELLNVIYLTKLITSPKCLFG